MLNFCLLPQAALPPVIGIVGSAGLAAAGAGIKDAYGMNSMEGYGYAKDMYHSSTVMDRHYDESQVLMSGREMAAVGGGVRMISGLGAGVGAGAGAGAGAGHGYGFAGSGGSQAALNEEFIKGYFYDVSNPVICYFLSPFIMAFTALN